MNRYVLALEFSCATLSLGTVGALCDYVGRKPAMFMTTVGQVGGCDGSLLVVVSVKREVEKGMVLCAGRCYLPTMEEGWRRADGPQGCCCSVQGQCRDAKTELLLLLLLLTTPFIPCSLL